MAALFLFSFRICMQTHLTAFPNNILEDMPVPSVQLRKCHNHSLLVPYARANYFQHSFTPMHAGFGTPHSICSMQNLAVI